MTLPEEKSAFPAVRLSCAACAPSLGISRASVPNAWSRRTSLVSAAALVLLPKCPLCLIGWLGAFGLGGVASHAGAIPLILIVLFCASQAVFLVLARRTEDRRALVVAAAGVSVLAACYAFGGGPASRCFGVGSLVAASVYNAFASARSRSSQR